MSRDVCLEARVGPLRLDNPIIVASGTFGYGQEFSQLLDVGRLGGLSTKGLSLRPRAGNPPPRIWETPAGMLNSIGLENVGVDAFVADKLPFLRQFDTAVIANVFGESIEEYREVASRLDAAEGVAALELNISCPNTEKGGMVFGVDPEGTRRVTEAVRRASRLPLIVKLTPNVTDPVELARAAADGGADALSAVNTYTGMAVDVERRRPRLATVSGGLSGPAIRPLAVHQVHTLVRRGPLPVIGMGGITRVEDALEFLIAGACAVQVGTASFFEPTRSVDLVDDLTRWCRERGVGSVQELIGTLDLG